MLACAASLGVLLRISLENSVTYGALKAENDVHLDFPYKTLDTLNTDLTPGLDDVDQWFVDDDKKQDWRHDKV